MTLLLSSRLFTRALSNSNVLVNSASLRVGENSFARLGRAYEEKCRKVLEKAFETPVQLLGGAGDGGIDLIWKHSLKSVDSLASSNKLLNTFIAQCKCKESGKIPPHVIRALEGSLASFPASAKIGCLISNHRATLSAMETLDNSTFPLINFIISECTGCLVIREIVLNKRFKALFPNVHVVAVRKQNLTYQTLRYTT